MNQRILIVEDEEHIAEGLRLNLEPEGFIVRHAADGISAIDIIMQDQPDLVILDIMLPGASGFEVCDTVRNRGSRVPIMFLTARNSEDARVKGLELGGDDYMTKPFSIRELIHRIRAILRRGEWYRQSAADGPVFHIGKNKVNFESYTAQTPSGDITLTQKECMVLKLLVENQGKVVTRDTILERVWGYDRYPSTRTIDNLILRLRKYFETDPKHPQYIHSLYGAGYKFVNDDDSINES